jgi:uncharacterized protein
MAVSFIAAHGAPRTAAVTFRAVARTLLAFAAFGLLLSLARAQGTWEATSEGLAPIPPLQARVTDLTHTLSASERDALESKLAAWEQKTGNQLAVLLVPSTKPEPIEAYSIRVAEAWKIGRKGQDNGALFTIAKDDRKMRIEVGYGLEGTLTDAMSKRIIADEVAPLFRQGQFAAGINAGVDRIMAVVEKGEPASPAKQSATKRSGPHFNLEAILVILFVVVPLVGRVLSAMLGKLLGSGVGAALVGAGAFFVVGSMVIAIIAGIVAFIVMLLFGLGGGFGRRGGGVWIPTGGGGTFGGGGGGGGGFSGGGGSFGGGGASGNW